MERPQRGVPALRRLAASAACAVLLLACAAPLDARSGALLDADPPPTYHGDIAPLLTRSCLPCHGEQSPHHALTSHARVVEHAERALHLMRSGEMPKGNVDRSGTCGDLIEPAPVSDADVDLLARFIDHGMLEGDPSAVRAPSSSEGPQPASSSDVAQLASEPYLPAGDAAGGSGDHRCFVLGGADSLADDAGLRAFRVLPTQPELVHHVMLFALDTDVDAGAARELDQATVGPGWPCFGTPGIPAARLIGVWTPGRDAVRFPHGHATRLGRSGLLAQIHYDGPAAAAPEVVRFELELGDGSERELRFSPFAAVDLVLPPRSERVRTEHRARLGLAAGSELLGVYPHMHALGTRLSLHAWLDGAVPEPTCLVDVPRWDYTFQELALYRAPLPIAVADPELVIDCEHGTLGVDREVRWGERMEDEMCMAFLVMALPR
jgi:hypothetical protein